MCVCCYHSLFVCLPLQMHGYKKSIHKYPQTTIKRMHVLRDVCCKISSGGRLIQIKIDMLFLGLHHIPPQGPPPALSRHYKRWASVACSFLYEEALWKMSKKLFFSYLMLMYAKNILCSICWYIWDFVCFIVTRFHLQLSSYLYLQGYSF